MTRLAQFSPAQHFFFFFSNLLFRWMTATPPAASLAFWKDEKSDGLASARQPNSLASGQLSVTPKKLIPFEVIKSIPINDILFNYLTLRGPNLTLPRNKLWSKGRRLGVLCALLKLFIDFCSKFMRLINEWSEPKQAKKTHKWNVNYNITVRNDCSIWLHTVKRDRKCVCCQKFGEYVLKSADPKNSHNCEERWSGLMHNNSLNFLSTGAKY